MPVYHSIIPGIHDDAHRQAFLSGRARFFASGGPRRCAARAKHGESCGAFALRGCDYCAHHAPNPVRKARRLRFLTMPKTAAQLECAKRREFARAQRKVWKRDRWAEGATVTLGLRDEAFQADVRALSLDPVALSPATIDAARWAWLNVQTRRMTPDQFRDRVRWHRAKD